MDDFSNLFLNGIIYFGLPLGVINGIAWIYFKTNIFKAIMSFFICVFICGMLGAIGGIPFTFISVFWSMKGTKYLKKLKEDANSSSNSSVGDKIIELNQLRKQNIITEEEFKEAKKDILNKVS